MPEDPVNNSLGLETTSLFQTLGAQAKQMGLEWHSEMDKTGQVIDTFKLPREAAPGAASTSQIMEALKWNSSTMAAMQDEAKRVDVQRASGSPLLDALAEVGGQLAAGDPRLPPVVSALGRASLRLNQTQQQLTNQKLGLLETMGQMANRDLAAGLAQQNYELNVLKEAGRDTRHDETLQSTIEKSVSSWARLVASKTGEAVDHDSFVSAARGFGMTDPNKIEDQFKGHVAEAAAFKKAKTEDRAAAQTFQERMAQFRAKTQLTMQSMRDITASKALAMKQGDINDRAAAGREFRGYGKIEKDVNAANVTIAGTQHMREVLADPANQKWIGYIIGTYPTDLIPDPAERQRVADTKAEFFTLMNDVRNSFGAGTRFWNPTEFANLSPKLAQASKTLATNAGIIDALERDAVRNAKKMVQANQDVDWATRGPIAFGDLWEQIKGSGPQGGLQGKAGGGKTAAAESPKGGAAPVGTIIEIDGKRQIKTAKGWELAP